ncbi:RNA recognition motif domain-containing protein [Vibrio algarum]|uniref:RNA-binding protein n=1 Tax=Vibrio algarum TaxID=3020714 RepID=A0ABT4YMF7_9VIBR|nr:RNA-binding protein [Vibrio sp. KJ40-1]MDB1122708.1 RNA-binding protein [Vibrio sp. KJ40-1]
MNSKKFFFLIIALAVLGAAIFSQLTVDPAISFVIGVVASAFVLNFSCSTSSSATAAPKDKPSTTTLYVGNLPYKANETNVRQVFSEHGEVFAVRLMKDKRTGKRRGFGFVVVGSNDVDNVISALNDHDYMQRTLKVRIANDPKHPESESSQ